MSVTFNAAARGLGRMRAAVLVMLCILGFGSLCASAAHAAAERPRTIVTTDPELDDFNSMLRFLLYSTDVQIEGLVTASSTYHWKGDGKGTLFDNPTAEYHRSGLNLCPCTSYRWYDTHIQDAVQAYSQVYDNLRVHDPNYPTPDYLRSKIREGNVNFEGDMAADTPGSDLIKQVLLDDKGGPVFLQAWGGPSTIARALKSIQLQYEGSSEWPAIYKKVSEKAIITAFGLQDTTYATYINPNWPQIEFRSVATNIWGYGARGAVLPEDANLLAPEWTQANVSSVGPIGAAYRVWGDGKSFAPSPYDYFALSGYTTAELRAMGYVVFTAPQAKGAWISEGDSSNFALLIDNGLRGDESASYGGWGGRQARNATDPTRWDGGNAAPDRTPAGALSATYSAARWFRAVQQDFAARLKWSVTPSFSGANHEPVVSVNPGLDVTAAPGELVQLKGAGTDPDANALTFKWWQYQEAGTYPGAVTFSTPASAATSFLVPTDAKPGQTIHAILEVTDNGTPNLTRWARVIVTVAATASNEVGASVTPTLALALGTAPSFGALAPGAAAKTYTATSTATVTTTAGDAALTVADVSPVATGRLANGPYALASPVQIKASNASSAGAFAPLGGKTNPTVLTTYAAPATNDVVTLSYQQTVGANEPLRSGAYSKGVTFTLATTNP